MTTPTTPDQKPVVRFSVLQRILHFLVMIGFTGLALTGFSMKFSAQGWARGVAYVLGAIGPLGSWHRFFAAMTYALVLAHLLWFFYFKYTLKGRLLGPDSILLRRKDFKDLWQHLGYFIGRAGMPRFDRFSYFEKLDYWAVFIGMNTMGLTGLVLWYPEFFTVLIPGTFINLAQVLHLYEAILAVALKFVVHIISAHFRPEIYPADKAIFTGKVTPERMRKEHPGEWERMCS
jgi:cytochrome b subunit of formate dehydrogenase